MAYLYSEYLTVKFPDRSFKILGMRIPCRDRGLTHITDLPVRIGPVAPQSVSFCTQGRRTDFIFAVIQI
jgi:hypothetical protein